MTVTSKRKTSLTLDATALDDARHLGINVSAVAEAALQQAVVQARQRLWLDENQAVFAAQAAWHEQNDHPLAAILAIPG